METDLCLAKVSRRTPPGGALACAPGSGTLPPHPAAVSCRPPRLLCAAKVAMETDLCLAKVSRRTRQRHLAAAPGSGILPPAALIVRRVNGSADQPMLSLYWQPARPPEGHWRAHPAAAPCRRHFAAAASEKSLSTGTRLVASAVGCGGRCRSTSRRTNNKNMFARRLAEQ